MAFNIFVRQSLREGRIPFDISLNQPNSETVAAVWGVSLCGVFLMQAWPEMECKSEC